MTNQTIPTYSQLPTIEQTGEHHSWKVFGEHDELGTMNFIGPEQVRAALQCATEGRVINLDLPLNLPSPALGSTRSGYKHHIRREQFGSDDHVDGFFLQSSSQWDALAHIRYSCLLYTSPSPRDS